MNSDIKGNDYKRFLMFANILILINLLVLVFTILDFAALSDIQNDYVSKKAAAQFDVNTESLPAWTDTPGEWSIVEISFYFRSFFLVAVLFALGFVIKKLRKYSVMREIENE